MGRLQALLARIKWPSCVLSLFRRLQRESQKKEGRKKDYSQFLPQLPSSPRSLSMPCVQDNPANQKRSLLHSSLPASDAPVQGLYRSVMYCTRVQCVVVTLMRIDGRTVLQVPVVAPCSNNGLRTPSMMTLWHAISLTRNNTSQEKKKRRKKPPLHVLFPSLSSRKIHFFLFSWQETLGIMMISKIIPPSQE